MSFFQGDLGSPGNKGIRGDLGQMGDYVCFHVIMYIPFVYMYKQIYLFIILKEALLHILQHTHAHTHTHTQTQTHTKKGGGGSAHTYTHKQTHTHTHTHTQTYKQTSKFLNIII